MHILRKLLLSNSNLTYFYVLLFNLGRCQNLDFTQYILQRVPVFSWILKYEKRWIFEDALAGITVGLTAIPQGIAYAVVAGLSPEVH